MPFNFVVFEHKFLLFLVLGVLLGVLLVLLVNKENKENTKDQEQQGEKEEQREQGEGRSINTFFYKKRENEYHSMSLVFFFVKKNQF